MAFTVRGSLVGSVLSMSLDYRLAYRLSFNKLRLRKELACSSWVHS